MLSCWTASRMPAVEVTVSSSWRNSGMGFWGEIFLGGVVVEVEVVEVEVVVGEVGLGRLVEWRRASTSRPLRGLMSLRLRLRLWSLGGTFFWGYKFGIG